MHDISSDVTLASPTIRVYEIEWADEGEDLPREVELVFMGDDDELCDRGDIAEYLEDEYGVDVASFAFEVLHKVSL